jgi:chromate transport protein ChrA
MGIGRTGTKFAGALVLWAVVIITALIVWLILIGDNPTADKVWSNLPAIITAILGPAGLNLGINEVRKALENGGLNLFGNKLGERGNVDDQSNRQEDKPC